MIEGKSIAVVVPAYNEEQQIGGVIATMPAFVDRIVIVDDRSRDKTADVVRSLAQKPELAGRLELIQTPENGGVGYAIATGYKWCRDHGLHVTAVMAGDGQMDPTELARVVAPVVRGMADYSKGNRLLNENSWRDIPRTRFIGNAGLSFLTKIVSGYWSVVDSQTGYTAISLRALKTLNLDRIYRKYGVPNDILTKLNVYNFKIAQMAIRPVYNVGEVSKMRTKVVIFTIPWLLVRLFFYRMFYKYVVRDFHPIFIYYMAGLTLLTLGSLGWTATVVLAILQATGRLLATNVSDGMMLLDTILLLSGLNMVLFGMWMDRDENKDLQLNLLPDDADDLTRPR